MLSPVFTTTTNLRRHRLSPRSSFAEPVPPARATTRSACSPEEVLLPRHDHALGTHLAPPVLQPLDYRDGHSRELAHGELCGTRYLVYYRGLGHPEGVTVGVNLPPVGLERLDSGGAYRDVRLTVAPGSAEGIRDHDRELGSHPSLERPPDHPRAPVRVEGEKGSMAALDVRPVYPGVCADEAVSRLRYYHPMAHSDDSSRLSQDQLHEL